MDERDELPASDEALALRIAGGDARALAAIYDRYVRLVYSMSIRILGPEEAEDSVQDVFLRLWEHAGKYQPERGRFSPWFTKLARNEIIDRVERSRRWQDRLITGEQVDNLLASLVDMRVDVEAEVWRRTRGRALAVALDCLPQEQRLTLVLAYFQGLPESAIARVLSCPLGTVKTRVRLGMRKLRACLMEVKEIEAR